MKRQQMRAFFSPLVMKVRRQGNTFVRVLKNKKKSIEVLCAVNPIHFKMKRNKRYSHFHKNILLLSHII